MAKAKTPTTYKGRKAAGLCVRPYCTRKPKPSSKRKNAAKKSYCEFHTKQNRKSSAAYATRLAAA
jgi:hypothetical protein